MHKKFILLFHFIFLASIVGAQQIKQSTAHQSSSRIYFEENKKQWPDQVLYKGFLPGGVVFLEEDRLTFGTHSLEDLEQIHEQEHDAASSEESKRIRNQSVRCHAWNVYFEGANKNPGNTPGGLEKAYSNYFIGNDQAYWAGHVRRFNQVQYNGLYDNIDLLVYSQNGNFKYDFVVAPGGDASNIQLRYDGVTPQLMRNGSLLLKVNTGELVEQSPVAWQLDGTKKIPVRCQFKLEGQTLRYSFPDGYDFNLPLIIDPVLIGATYSGSTITTFGHSATFDNLGNVYSGGRCFGQGYPATVGAYDLTFANGVDIAISKYDQTVSNLTYATYLGGGLDEYVHSMFVHTNGDLYIYGSANSTNYPTTTTAFDITQNGNVDIIVSQLDPTGSSLLGSTYVGGSQDDGIDAMIAGYNQRGEIVVDANGTAFIASFSSSSNFPTIAGCIQTTIGGGQDAVVFALFPGLSLLSFSTFIGGSNDDGARGIRVSTLTGDIFISGTTRSANFPVSAWAYQSVHAGGSDGYVARLNNTGTVLFSATFFGTSGADRCFFVDIDNTDDVYIYGEAGSTGAPITPGVYSSAGPMYVAKFDPLLITLIYSTQVGPGNINATPLEATAFLVDICENVYLAGFGGNNYPLTSNAFYTNANSPGSYYVAVLSRDAISLSFATLFGGSHVDGGTSRFDPNGIIYQAVCESGSAFPTTASAYSPNNASGSWDVCAFKIDFQQVGVQAVAAASPNATGCAPFNVSFLNSSNGVDYIWDYGDGSALDTTTSPSHIFTDTGTFQVTLIAIDSSSCITRDTAYLTITVLASPQIDLGLDSTFCETVSSYVLDAGNPGCTYQWSTGATSQSITPSLAGSYWVIADNGTCTDQDTVILGVVLPPIALRDSAVCQGQQVQFTAASGQSWTWSTGATSQSITVNQAGDYSLIINDAGCLFYDTITFSLNPYPIVDLGNDSIFCSPSAYNLDAGNVGASYQWSTGDTIQQIQVDQSGTITVEVTALNCTTNDTVTLNWVEQPVLGSNLTLCNVLSVTLDPGIYPAGSTYTWSTGATTPTIEVSQPGLFYVTVNTGTCILQDTVELTGIPGEGAVYIPNSFTPNQDGLNEELRAMGDGIIEFRMRIYNRWGLLVYESRDINKGWNGRFGDRYVQQDTYVCILDYRTTCNKELQARKVSHVTVIGSKN